VRGARTSGELLVGNPDNRSNRAIFHDVRTIVTPLSRNLHPDPLRTLVIAGNLPVMKILLTGGTGYIGSHTALAVLASGHEPILLDDYSNSRPEVVDRLSQIAGRPLIAMRGDVRDVGLLKSLFETHVIDAVIHFAAKKSVAESVADPISYLANNVG
jgi:FlaA1/EpsC-like NDP-sugar epimerase